MDEILDLERDLAMQLSALATFDFDERLLVPEELVVSVLGAANRRGLGLESFEATALEIMREWALEPTPVLRHLSG